MTSNPDSTDKEAQPPTWVDKFDTLVGGKKWSDLAALGRSRILRTSYVWLLVVPLAAKAINSMPDTVMLGESEFVLNFGLPFSWHAFYFAALFFTAGNLIYWVRCPSIVKDHPNLQHFREGGKGDSHLLEYAVEIGRHEKRVPGVAKGFQATGPGVFVEDEGRNQAARDEFFWNIRDRANNARRGWMRACAFCYGGGLVLIGFVMLQNLLAVVATLR